MEASIQDSESPAHLSSRASRMAVADGAPIGDHMEPLHSAVADGQPRPPSSVVAAAGDEQRPRGYRDDVPGVVELVMARHRPMPCISLPRPGPPRRLAQ